jgi:hypothetical protein
MGMNLIWEWQSSMDFVASGFKALDRRIHSEWNKTTPVIPLLHFHLFEKHPPHEFMVNSRPRLTAQQIKGLDTFEVRSQMFIRDHAILDEAMWLRLMKMWEARIILSLCFDEDLDITYFRYFQFLFSLFVSLSKSIIL